MRILSTLLIAALGGVVGAAPAAPIQLRPPAKKKSEEDTKRHDYRTIGRVVLRADSSRAGDTTATSGEAAATIDAAPALRVRRLPSVPAYRAPIRELGADISAGLLATPPPRA